MRQHGPSCLTGPVSPNLWLPPTSEMTTAMIDATPDRTDDADIRQDLVERVRREIAAGTYETAEKWELALARLFDDLERRQTTDG